MHCHPFQPFTIRLTSGDRHKVADIALAALMRSTILIASPNSDKRVMIPCLHIAAVETEKGAGKAPARKRRR